MAFTIALPTARLTLREVCTRPYSRAGQMPHTQLDPKMTSRAIPAGYQTPDKRYGPNIGLSPIRHSAFDSAC